jgi:phosphohistidine phosphatase SixA
MAIDQSDLRSWIYLVRHGDAVPEHDAGSDRDRWLSQSGRDAARALGESLRNQGVTIDDIIASPLPRAIQTAELIAAALGYRGAIVTRRCLEPAGSPSACIDAMRTLGANLLVISHEPLVSALAAMLLGRSSFPPFRTAQCHRFENAL